MYSSTANSFSQKRRWTATPGMEKLRACLWNFSKVKYDTTRLIPVGPRPLPNPPVLNRSPDHSIRGQIGFVDLSSNDFSIAIWIWQPLGCASTHSSAECRSFPNACHCSSNLLPGPVGFRTDSQVQAARHPLRAAGLYYVQEPSAMVETKALDGYPGHLVLDVAASRDSVLDRTNAVARW